MNTNSKIAIAVVTTAVIAGLGVLPGITDAYASLEQIGPFVGGTGQGGQGGQGGAGGAGGTTGGAGGDGGTGGAGTGGAGVSITLP